MKILARFLSNSIFQVILGILISGVSLYFSLITLDDFNLNDISKTLHNINYLNIAIGCLLLIFSIIIRSIRWKLFFTQDVDLKLLFKGQLIGYFGSNVLPLRLGEILRAIFVSNQSQFSSSFIFGTIMIERTLDLIFLLILSFVTYFYNGKIFFQINSIISFKLIIICILLIVFSLIIVIIFSKKMPKKISALLIEFVNGINSIQLNKIIYILILSILLWMVYLCDVYIIQILFFPNITISDCLIILVVCSATFAIPSVPGNIGPYHFGAILSLKILGYSDLSNKILLSSIILHAHNYILFTLLGAYYYYKSNFGIKLVKSLLRKPQIVYESSK